MIKFNSNNIIAGYIKQLLSSFNLPTIKVFKEGETTPFENTCYIKDNKIQLYKDKNWIDKGKYYFGADLALNDSKTLKINNLIYDTYTHEYLGDYLRFIRDYKNIDLMPLYNCFSNKIINNFNFDKVNTNISVDSKNNNDFKIYAIPVKFGKKYTIAIDSNLPITCVCGFYDSNIYSVNYNDGDLNGNKIYSDTFKSFNNISFTAPILYENLANPNFKPSESYIRNEKNLKLFIKLPQNNNSSIVVLEGDYITGNNTPTSYPKTIINFEHINNQYKVDKDKLNIDDIKLVTKLQLLAYNSEISYPFADRLVEYLTGNVIGKEDQIEDNIIRIQQNLYEKFKKSILSYNETPGEWNDKYRLYLYDFMTKSSNTVTDLLGYVDKDVEKALGADINIYSKIGELSDDGGDN